MSARPKTQFTEKEYLALDAASEFKHELIGGQVFQMAGAEPEHNSIVLGVGALLFNQIADKPCRAYTSDQQVHMVEAGAYAYPDVVVVCGEPQFGSDKPRPLLNPTVIIEVLSASTEKHDRGMKFQQYRTLASLREYLLIAQDRPSIEQWVRQPDNRWLLHHEAVGLDAVVTLPSIGCDLPLAQIYRQVDFTTGDHSKSGET